MTYYEAYSQCKTLDEMLYAVKKDALFAAHYNTDRLKPIEKAALAVFTERHDAGVPGWEIEKVNCREKEGEENRKANMDS